MAYLNQLLDASSFLLLLLPCCKKLKLQILATAHVAFYKYTPANSSIMSLQDGFVEEKNPMWVHSMLQMQLPSPWRLPYQLLASRWEHRWDPAWITDSLCKGRPRYPLLVLTCMSWVDVWDLFCLCLCAWLLDICMLSQCWFDFNWHTLMLAYYRYILIGVYVGQ